MTAVSNTFSDIAPKIVARALKVLRPRLILPQVANKDYSTGEVKYGDTINVPVPWVSTPSSLTPSNVLPAPTNRTVATVPVVVDQWYHDDFGMTDQDIQKIQKDKTFVPMGLEAVVDGLATKINQSLWEMYYRFHLAVGNSGSDPWTVAYIAAAKKLLNESKAPKTGRVGVMDFTGEAALTQLAAFSEVQKSADPRVITEGEIGRKLGFDWYADDDVPEHTIGSITNTPITSGVTAVGATTLTLECAAGEVVAFKQGDIITFNTDTTRPYSVQADLDIAATNTGTLTISPAISLELADDSSVEFSAGGKGGVFDASATQSLIMHPSCLVFVSRTQVLSEADKMTGAQVFSLSDPLSGITLRLELIREYKQTLWDVDALWGRAVHRPELGVRVLGI
jgi:hypothetical protein